MLQEACQHVPVAFPISTPTAEDHTLQLPDFFQERTLRSAESGHGVHSRHHPFFVEGKCAGQSMLRDRERVCPFRLLGTLHPRFHTPGNIDVTGWVFVEPLLQIVVPLLPEGTPLDGDNTAAKIDKRIYGKANPMPKERKIKKDEKPGWRIAKPSAEPINGAVQGVATITARKPVPKEFI